MKGGINSLSSLLTFLHFGNIRVGPVHENTLGEKNTHLVFKLLIELNLNETLLI